MTPQGQFPGSLKWWSKLQPYPFPGMCPMVCISTAAYLTSSWANLNNLPFFAGLLFSWFEPSKWDMGKTGNHWGQSEVKVWKHTIKSKVKMAVFLLPATFGFSQSHHLFPVISPGLGNWSNRSNSPDRFAAHSLGGYASIAEAFEEQKQEQKGRSIQGQGCMAP